MQENDVRLDGEVAVVTGAAQGIGEAVARTLATFGARLALLDLQAQQVEVVAASVRAEGGDATAFHTDVRDEGRLRDTMHQVMAQLGRVDVLVNNAGGTFRAPFLQVNRRGFDTLVDLNLTSVWTASQIVAAQWIETGTPGRIVNVSSTEGMKACPGFAAYAAAKAGVISLTKTLSAELGPYGIRVNCIAPDYTETPNVPARSEVAERVPLRRYGVPGDMAGPVLFFASRMSAWVTGQTLVVDGGSGCAARVEGAFPHLPQDEKTR